MGDPAEIRARAAQWGLVTHAQEWKCSSVHEYAGVDWVELERRCGLEIDDVWLRAGKNAWI